MGREVERPLRNSRAADGVVRKSYKRALGIPDTTSNGKLAALGLHNTVEEIIEAQRVSQLERLTKSASGRHILASLGIRYERQTGEKADVPRIDRKSHPLLEKIDNQESWETLLLCSDPSVQNQLVQLAEDAAKTQRVQAAV
ncbi:hypothetical protein HPB47_009624 [Ixodes persulcatus]|uniref:Uncharacterized protein n=1 Tax=Ixodes persulcatus TaxID=34615 RepID=A0AC60P1C0_IXOPE|nr:hypothetical protein HPB47_009624 [Ixodes persulcatus]